MRQKNERKKLRTFARDHRQMTVNVFIIHATGLHEEVDRECKDFYLMMIFLQSKQLLHSNFQPFYQNLMATQDYAMFD